MLSFFPLTADHLLNRGRRAWLVILWLVTGAVAAVAGPVGSTLQSDIAYGPDPRQRFDAYLPIAAPEPAPIIFMVHGGAWQLGDKAASNIVDDKVARWVARGFVFISVNYRMLPDADPLEQAEDVVRALAYVQQHAGDYHADPSRVILMGHSAGAHLVSLISTHPTLAPSQGVTPWLGTVSLDSAAYDVAYIMQRPHLPLYDNAFGTDPVFWAAVSPYQVLVQPVPPILAVCSSLRTDSMVQAARFDLRGQVIGTSIDVLTKDYTHEEINEKLGEPGAYTDEVEAFMHTLDPVVAARLDQGPAAAPVFTTQPGSLDRTIGAPVMFSAVVIGNPSPTYQWLKNGVAIPGATAASLAIAAISANDAGTYTLVATNAVATVTSNPATLTVPPAATKADFNADGKPDLIWSNSNTGERALWLMNGTNRLGVSTLGIFPLEWTVAATGDFNFDGKPDLVWSNSLTGERALWLMNGTNRLGVSTLGIFPLEWTAAATGDFNFDGKPDIVWSNSVTGERALWLMNGTIFISASTLGVFPLEWTVAATGDFNFDGKPDLVWSNSLTGERALWLMDGTNFLSASTLGIFPREWTVAGVGDYNADGKPDLIWSNSITGERALWLMNGTNFLAASTLGIFPLEWTVGN